MSSRCARSDQDLDADGRGQGEVAKERRGSRRYAGDAAAARMGRREEAELRVCRVATLFTTRSQQYEREELRSKHATRSHRDLDVNTSSDLPSSAINSTTIAVRKVRVFSK